MIKTNKIAFKVKLAHQEANMEIKRTAHAKFRGYARQAEYLKYNIGLKEPVLSFF